MASDQEIGEAGRTELLRALSDAVQTRREGQVLASFLGERTGAACVVLARSREGWYVAGRSGIELELGAALPESSDPGSFMAARPLAARVHWASRELFHGRRVVGRLFLAAPELPGALVAGACAVAAPFLAASWPRTTVPGALELHIGQIVHDLRQPLAALRLTLDVLEETRLLEKSHLQRCQRSVVRLADMVDDLLLLSAPAQLPMAPLRLGPLVHELADEHVEHARRREVSIAITVREDPMVLGARQSLQRGIGNVLDNAIEMSPPGSTVEIVVDANDTDGVVEICDQGPGVPHELRQRVFEPFFTTRTAGTGLGLAVTRCVAQAHGGSAQFLDSRRPGAVLRLAIPRQRATTAIPTHLPAEASIPIAAS
jgi:signal transduction histidine kinase